MGRSGALVFFSPSAKSEAVSLLVALAEQAQVEKIRLASRYVDTTLHRLRQARGEASIDDEPEAERESLRKPTLTQACDFFDQRKTLSIYGVGAMDSRLNDALDAIEKHIRGDWVIDSTFLHVGPEEHFEDVDTLRYFGHSEVSVVFHGRGSPLDWAACRRMVLELPEVRAFAERLKPILGEVKTCVYWDG